MSGQIAEATINYTMDPHVGNTDIAYWLRTGSTDLIFRYSSDDAKVGTGCIYMTTAVGAQSTASRGFYSCDWLEESTDASIYAGQTWTLSGWGRNEVLGDTGFFTQYYEQKGASTSWVLIASNNHLFPTTDWTYFKHTDTFSADATAHWVRTRYVGLTGDLWLDAIQWEQKPYPTPYCDGDLGDGHEWWAGSDASASIRGDQVLSYGVGSSGSTDAIINEENGGFACRVAFPTMESGITNRIFRWWDSYNTEGIYLNLTATGTIAGVVYTTDVMQTYLSYDASAWEDHTWYHIAMTWEANDVRLYIEGVQDTQDVSAAMPTIASTVIHIGESTGTQPMNGWVDELAIFSYTPGPRQIKELAATNKAGAEDKGWVHDSLWVTFIGNCTVAGTVVLSGAYSMWLDLSMFVSGLLELTGTSAPITTWKRFFSGVVDFVSGGLTDYPTVFYDQVVSGLITFSGRFAKPLGVFGAILSQIRLAIGLTSAEQPVKSQIVMGLTETDGSPLSADVEIEAN